MDNQFVFALVTGIISFFAGFFSFVFVSKSLINRNFEKINPAYIFIPFLAVSTICFTLLYFISSKDDFVFPINILSILVPLFCSAAIAAISFSPRIQKYTPLIILAAAILSSFALPSQFLLCNGAIPFILDRLLIIAIWFSFSSFYYILNGVDGVMPLQTLSICAGIFVLAWLEATPFFYGLCALSLFGITGAYSIFNWYPSRLNLNQTSCQALGFLAGWILISTSSEGASSSSFILLMYYPIELIVGAIKKVSLRDKYADIISNTTYYQANISGLSPHNICVFLFKLQIVFIILSSFQIYAPNPYSLPILSFIIGIWFLSKLKNWQTPNKTIRDLNQDFMEDIKNNIEDIKSNIGKD